MLIRTFSGDHKTLTFQTHYEVYGMYYPQNPMVLYNGGQSITQYYGP